MGGSIAWPTSATRPEENGTLFRRPLRPRRAPHSPRKDPSARPLRHLLLELSGVARTRLSPEVPEERRRPQDARRVCRVPPLRHRGDRRLLLPPPLGGHLPQLLRSPPRGVPLRAEGLEPDHDPHLHRPPGWGRGGGTEPRFPQRRALRQ